MISQVDHGAGKVEYAVLGSPSAVRDGVRLALGGPQQRRLLALLLTQPNQSIPVERLVEAMWDDPPPEARRTLMSYVSRLRRVLGESAVIQTDGGYSVVVGPQSLDAQTFERLLAEADVVPPTEAVSRYDEALALVNGPAFDELATEWWARPVASRLDDLVLVARERRAERLVAVGRADEAIADLDRLLVEQPTRPTTVVAFARAAASVGREAEALRAVNQFREVLANSTGLEPPSTVLAVEQAILTGAELGAPTARGYRLGEQLGEGAHGAVYRSVQPTLGRDVAVKVVRPEFADDPAFVERFELEAQLAARLEHPHIVPLYDFWREPRGAYLVFRLLSGGTLADDLRRGGRWPLERVTQFVERVGDALGLAHSSNVVHGDIKPSNVLLDVDGRPYLGDFGLAITKRGGAWTTPATSSDPSPYVPPEVSGGRSPTVASDIFSFGAVVRELLTGDALPLRADSLSGVAAPVAAVVRRATAIAPEQRFDSVPAVIAAWRRALGVDLESADAGGDIAIASTLHNPYVGLRAFDESDRAWFRTTERAVDDLLHRIDETAFVVLVGGSGSGKSSLLHAGLTPALRADGWTIASMVPGDAPLARLADALGTVAVGDAGDTVDQLTNSIVGSSRRLALVIDQLEELWTGNTLSAQQQFISQIDRLIESNPGVVTVVAALRADFFDRPLSSSLLGPRMAAATVPLVPMNAVELRRAIVDPSASAGVRFDRDLEVALVAEAMANPASLPMLQFMLRELFENRTPDASGAVVTLAAYRRLGGLAGSLARRADQAYDELDPDDQESARQLLLRLAPITEAGAPTSRRLRLAELPQRARSLVAHFVERRLLVLDIEPSSREPTVELAHEALISSWPRLRNWIDAGHDRQVITQQLELAARQWTAGGCAESDLYRGERLHAVTLLVDAGELTISENEQAFVDASRDAASVAAQRERRVRRRLRRLLAATSVALAVALTVGVVALDQRRDARAKAESARVASLVSLAASLAGSKRDLAALIALEASRRDPSAATDGAMLSALYSEPSFLSDLRPSQPLWSITASDDASVLWGKPEDSTAGLLRLDVGTGASTVVPVPAQQGRQIEFFEPVADAQLLVRYDGEPAVSIVDIDSQLVLATATLAGRPASVAVSPSRQRVAVTLVGAWDVPATVVVLTLPDLTRVNETAQPGPMELGEGGEWWSSSAWIDDSTLAIGSTSGRIALWDPAKDEVVATLNDPPSDAVGQVAGNLAVTGDGSTLVAGDYAPDGSRGRGLMAFDLDTLEPRWSRPVRANAIFAIDERNGAVLANEAGPGSSRAFAFDLDTGDRLDRVYDIQHGSLCDLVVAREPGRLFISSCNDASVGMWALDGSTPAGSPVAAPGWVTGWNLWDFGTRIGVYDHDGKLHLRQLTSGVLEPTPPNVDLDAWSWFLSDGRLMNVYPIEDEVVFFDPDLQSSQRFTVDIPDNPNAMAWSRDGSVLVVGDGVIDDIRVIDVVGERERWRLTTGEGSSLGLDVLPDGSRLFAGSRDEVAAVFDLGTGERIGSLPGLANTTVSPGGTLVAGSSFDGTISFWDTDTLRPAGEPLSGSTSFSNSIQFTFDGRWLVTSGLDNTQRLWDVASRRQVGPNIPVLEWTVAIAPDSSRIAVNMHEGVRMIDLDREALRRSVCAVAGRDLSAEEWRQYIGGTQHVLCPADDR